MSKIAMVVKLTAQPGKRDELIGVLSKLVQATEDEAGTLTYVLHTQPDDENAVWFYELYESAEALQTHSASDAMRAAAPQFAGLLAGRAEMTRLVPEVGKGL